MAQPLKAKEVNMRGRDTVDNYNTRDMEKACLGTSPETKGSRLTNTIEAAWEDVINLLERLEDMIHGEDDARVQPPRCRPAIHTLELLLQNGPEAIDEYHQHAAQIISRIRGMVIE
jgi:hypothetical protein